MYQQELKRIAKELGIKPNVKLYVHPCLNIDKSTGMFCEARPPMEPLPTIDLYGGRDFDREWRRILRHEMYHLFQLVNNIELNQLEADLFANYGRSHV